MADDHEAIDQYNLTDERGHESKILAEYEYLSQYSHLDLKVIEELTEEDLGAFEVEN